MQDISWGAKWEATTYYIIQCNAKPWGWMYPPPLPSAYILLIVYSQLLFLQHSELVDNLCDGHLGHYY